MRRKLAKERRLYYEWCERSPWVRIPQTKKELAKELGVTVRTLVEWDKEEKRISFRYSSKAYFRSRQEEIDKAAADAFIKRPNSQLFTSIKKVAGDITEVPISVSVGVFTGDDYHRLDREAAEELREDEKRLREGIQGMEEVQGESALLPD